MDEIYLDYNATTPLDPRVRAVMKPFGEGCFGNAASQHAWGRDASEVVEDSRRRVAGLVGATPAQVVFTSGATESNNLAIKGLVWASGEPKPHVVVSSVEHPAVLDCAAFLETQGVSVTRVPVNRSGLVDPAAVDDAIRPTTVLVSIMAANNEIGSVQPIAAIGEVARSSGVSFHCDAAQAVGKIPVDLERCGIDLLSISAHKLYGPKGVGALVLGRSPRPRLTPLIHGGGHERGLRSGTLNVSGCAGFGEACRIAGEEMAMDAQRLSELSEGLARAIRMNLDSVASNGPPAAERVPGNLSLTFAGIDAQALIARCPEVALSSGSACSSATPTPSHVLTAIGLTPDEADSTLRFGLGRFTTPREIADAAEIITNAAKEIRRLNSTAVPVEF